METKIFLTEEHETTIFDSSEIEKWMQLVEELGLERQKSFLEKGQVSPLPFPLMTEAENQIYHRVFETHEKVDNYAGEVIPLNVLSTIALCRNEKYFDRIEIWYSRQNPDPLVIGRKFNDENARERDYTWEMSNYLIAQWGPKLKSLLELLPIYDELMRAEIKSSFDNSMKHHEDNLRKWDFQIKSISA